ncbi:MAG: YbjN domain-containing protein [Gammaproteobacteria bacterium]|nr:YbjN domain-containing protein [Gammaproteobacteria bacterium]
MNFIEEHDVDTDRVEALFKQAYYSVSRDEDDDLVVSDELSVYVMVQESSKRIRYMAPIHVNEDAERAEKLEVVNRINDEYTFCRVYLPSDRQDMIGADLELTFEGGIIPLHVISLFRKFVSSVTHSLLEHGEGIT